MLNKLILLANKLDSFGLIDPANKVDKLIKDISIRHPKKIKRLDSIENADLDSESYEEFGDVISATEDNNGSTPSIETTDMAGVATI